jgi:hypothetical protein
MALTFSVVAGIAGEDRDVAVAAFEQGWHGMWVFEVEPDQQKLAQHIQQGQGIGSFPGSVQLYVNQAYLEEDR